ncbi:MAG: alpha-glucosidase [Bacteroidia bacterium]|nr:alpha-glucosidase [Bacteroidia bacterium]
MEKRYFKENIVYQIYPRSFYDSNGDGIGDLRGIISKLDYLKDLGVGIVWLSPVYKSPNQDMGYDVSDYMDINPEYGTLEDMDDLIKEAKKRGIRVIMDLVVNHTSDEHRWFVESRKPDSPYRDYYYWRKGRKDNKRPPNNWQSMFSGSAWKYDPEVGLWYLHLYGDKQVDLNFHNPKVIEEVKAILRFWLDRGIYGFRCDVINQIYKTSLENGRQRLSQTGIEHYLNQDGNHAILRQLYDEVFSKYDCMNVGETYMVDYANARRFIDRELDMVFQFDHVNVDRRKTPLFARRYLPRRMKKILFGWQENVDWNTNYLENHDQLRSIPRFGDEKRYYLESGKMLAMMIMFLKGTTFVYQGQEIGMTNIGTKDMSLVKDVSALNVYGLLRKMGFPKKASLKLVNNINRDNARTPMQWDDSPQAGFTSGTPWLNVNPNYVNVNVKKNLATSDSLYHFYQKIIASKKEIPASCYGDFKPLYTSGNVMAFLRTYANDEYTIILNLSGKKQKNPLFLRGEVILSNYAGTTTYEGRVFLEPFEGALIKTH